jgi:predicted secreted protein
VAATGSPTPGYQWQLSTDNGSNWSILVNGGAYSGVSLATLTVTPGSGFNNYRYRCVAGNSEGSATSNSATLTVSVPNVAPNITTQPSNQTVSAGQSASFIVAATGAPTPGYQWQVSTDGGSNWGILVNGGAYSGVTRPTLAVATNSGLNGYLYRVVVTNSSGAATSNAASLTVTGPAAGAPAINLQPSAQMLTVGQNVNFTVAATGSPTPGYQWQLSTDSGSNWSILVGAGAYSGVNLATLTVVPSAGFNGYQYRCVVSNSAGSVTSNAAALTEAALSAIETWRQQYFGSPSNSGNGADNATSDHDGVPNLVKYGLVITPGSPGVSSLPAAQTLTYAEGKRLALIFSRAPARNDVTLVVQGSDNLAGPWTTLATSANGAAFTGPGFVSETNADGGLKSVEIRDTVNMSAAPHRFMRIEVTH